jgi:hypothetical protein
MLHYLKLFYGIMLLRNTPQDVPASHTLFWLTTSFFFIIGVAGGAQILPSQRNLLINVFSIALFLSFLFVLLKSTRRLPRFLQTATAMFGVGCIFRIIELPMDILLANSDLAVSDPMLPIVGMFLFILITYNTLVAGHILKHALSSSMLIGVFCALAYFILYIVLIFFLFHD